MFSYVKDIKRFRPLLKIQTFIQGGDGFLDNQPLLMKKKKLVIRDWFKLALWYVRLRKTAKGQTPF